MAQDPAGQEVRRLHLLTLRFWLLLVPWFTAMRVVAIAFGLGGLALGVVLLGFHGDWPQKLLGALVLLGSCATASYFWILVSRWMASTVVEDPD